MRPAYWPPQRNTVPIRIITRSAPPARMFFANRCPCPAPPSPAGSRPAAIVERDDRVACLGDVRHRAGRGHEEAERDFFHQQPSEPPPAFAAGSRLEPAQRPVDRATPAAAARSRAWAWRAARGRRTTARAGTARVRNRNRFSGSAFVAGVGQQRQEEKRRAKHVLAFGHPSDGFDVERGCAAKKNADHRRRPHRPGRQTQPAEKQEGVERRAGGGS